MWSGRSVLGKLPGFCAGCGSFVERRLTECRKVRKFVFFLNQSGNTA